MVERGVVAALVTPLDEDEHIDVPSLESLLEWVLAGGVKGVFVGGTVGEGPALRDGEKATLYRETVRVARGRMAVLANVSEVSTARSLDLLTLAQAAGVDVVVANARFVFPRRSSGESARHVAALARAADRPVWFYEIPATTGVTHSFEQLREIMSLPNVTGMKFSSPDQAMFTRCVRELAPRPVLTGNVPDIAYAASIGAAGAVAGMASLAPHLCVQAFEAGLAGRMAEAERIQAMIQKTYNIYGGEGLPLWPAAQKHALKRLGIIKTSVATAPFLRLGPAEEAAIDAAMEAWGFDLRG